METGIYTLTQNRNRISGEVLLKALLCLIYLSGIFAKVEAQNTGHHEDSVIVLPRTDISVSILSSSEHLLRLEMVSSKTDSIQPMFIELSANGFLFSTECIQSQSVNNVPILSNLEKIWGPEFISLGIGCLPPLGRYQMDFAILNGVPPGATITIRVYGTVNGNSFLWTSHIKK